MIVRSKAKITSKGQLTLPGAVRLRLGVGPGDSVAFEINGDQIRVTRDREPGAFEKWAGRFRNGHRGQERA